jgi:hypothetical protein
MNWGTGIIIFFTVFATTMITAVVRSTYYAPQMVQKDYYNLDLNYQDRMQRKQNMAASLVVPKTQFDAAAGVLRIVFPADLAATTGTAKCFRNSTTKEDVHINFDSTDSVAIPMLGKSSGRWYLEVEWTAADRISYFWETVFELP